jgi:hypothetical protein
MISKFSTKKLSKNHKIQPRYGKVDQDFLQMLARRQCAGFSQADVSQAIN